MNEKVLIVDDAKDTVWALKDYLEMSGYQVSSAYTGEEGLRMVSKDVDIMLLDIMMRPMSGTEVLEKLKERGSEIPVVMITAKADVGMAVECMKYENVYDYITKPFPKLETLDKKIQDTLKEYRYRMEIKRLEAQVAASEAEKKVERLAAAAEIAAEAAHEIKNPLQVIKTGVSLLKKVLPKEDPRTWKTIKRMDDALIRLTGFIDDLLHISRPIELRIGKVDINNLIKEGMDEVPAETLSNIEVSQKLSSNLPLIEADFGRLKQVIVNLIKNAVEAMQEVKSKRLEVRSEIEEGFVKIVVSDTGKGISEEKLAKIFDPFFTTKGKGIGLGLAI